MIDPTLIGHIPAWQCLIRDRRTRGDRREVYLLILSDLDLSEFTPVKTLYVQETLKMSRRGAIGALHWLVENGYLERGTPDETGVNTYRLVWACPVGSQIAPPQAS